MSRSATDSPPVYLMKCPRCGRLWETRSKHDPCPSCHNGTQATDSPNEWLAGDGLYYCPS